MNCQEKPPDRVKSRHLPWRSHILNWKANASILPLERNRLQFSCFGMTVDNMLHILNMGLVENTLTGNLILTVMLAFAEYERGMIVERTQTGKVVARQDPNFKDGRPKKFSPEQIQLALSLLDQGKTYRQITTMTGISKSTLIRAKRN